MNVGNFDFIESFVWNPPGVECISRAAELKVIVVIMPATEGGSRYNYD